MTDDELIAQQARENADLEQQQEVTEFQEVIWGEMSPDVYAGPSCNEVEPRWHLFCEGDMDSDFSEDFALSAKHFPPGTKVSVQQPCCPDCGEIAELCAADDCCEFDWKAWALSKFS
jgi:hypothetical protein